jgi:hypothetical protein
MMGSASKNDRRTPQPAPIHLKKQGPGESESQDSPNSPAWQTLGATTTDNSLAKATLGRQQPHAAAGSATAHRTLQLAGTLHAGCLPGEEATVESAAHDQRRPRRFPYASALHPVVASAADGAAGATSMPASA